MRRPGIGLGFELGVSFNAEGEGGGGSFTTSFSDINSGLFGVDTNQSGTGSGTESRRENINVSNIESVDIDEAGLLKLIDDSLKGVSGIAEIFGQEAGAGLFSSSTAKKGTEDLLAKIVGELAKVTATKTTQEVGGRSSSGTSDTTTQQSGGSSGIVDTIGGFFGF